MEKSNLDKVLEAINLEDLGIQPPTTVDGEVKISRDELPTFKEVWKTYIMPLSGKVVHLLKGRTNTITYVGNDGLKRISINKKESRLIPIGVFEYTYQKLIESPDGIIWREKEILAHSKAKYNSLSSAIVVAVFAQAVPFISRFNGSQGLQLNLK